jgi:hypothetical protein
MKGTNWHDLLQETPIADWTDGASENASFTLTTSNPKEDNFDGSSGCTFSFLMACNTSIFFLLVFWFRKSSICSLCHSNSMTYYFTTSFLVVNGMGGTLGTRVPVGWQ